MLRILAFTKDEALLPKSVATALESKAPNFWKWANAVVKEDSVTYIWNEQLTIERTKARLAKVAAAK